MYPRYLRTQPSRMTHSTFTNSRMVEHFTNSAGTITVTLGYGRRVTLTVDGKRVRTTEWSRIADARRDFLHTAGILNLTKK